MTGPEPVASSDAERTREEGAAPRALRDAPGLTRGAVLAGKYRLELQLGAGGMAVVWSAYHLELEMPVAVKLLRGGHDARLAERLRREARAAARLVHPGIVRVLDVATTADGDPFIVMELLTGETLTDLLIRERVSALRVVQLLLPIIDGLAMAHAEGVIHRDLKPDNVFLAVEGEHLQPKLLDFGIAKLNEGPRHRTKLTEQGIALGSPRYMSPEQIRGEEVDFRSDIWSLCVLLYKAIGGKAPFSGVDPRATFDAILTSEPAPLPLGAGVDGHLARIVLGGLNKSPAARPASMRQLGQQLARWLLLHGVAVDASGAPLVTWLTSEPAPKLQEESAPPARKAAVLSAPPPPSDRMSTTAPSARPRAAVAARQAPQTPASRRGRPVRFVLPKHRRWLLWALAGTLVAGASFAFSNSDAPSAREPVSPARIVAAAPPARVLAASDDHSASVPRIEPVATSLSAQPSPEMDRAPAVAQRPAITPRVRRATLPF